MTWTAPSASYIPPITDYVVQYSSNSGSTWTTFSDGTSTSTSATVTGLTNGTAYTFRVAAVNGVGTGAYSTASSAVTPVSGDPLFGNVALLLHMDGSNGSTTFTDSSGTPKTVTANGGAVISTAQSKFGGASGYFAGSGNYLSVAASSALEPAGNDFTIEFWWYTATTSRQWFIHSQTDYWLGLDYLNGALGMWASSNGSGWNIIESDGSQGRGSLTVPLNQWNHVAFVRSGSNWSIYLNGTLDKTVTASGSVVDRSTQAKYIASWAGGGNVGGAVNGYIDEFRYTVGVARYTSNFTPSTSAFPNS